MTCWINVNLNIVIILLHTHCSRSQREREREGGGRAKKGQDQKVEIIGRLQFNFPPRNCLSSCCMCGARAGACGYCYYDYFLFGCFSFAFCLSVYAINCHNFNRNIFASFWFPLLIFRLAGGKSWFFCGNLTLYYTFGFARFHIIIIHILMIQTQATTTTTTYIYLLYSVIFLNCRQIWIPAGIPYWNCADHLRQSSPVRSKIYCFGSICNFFVVVGVC